MRPVTALGSGLVLLLMALPARGQAPDATLRAPHVREDGQRDRRVHVQLDSHFLYGIGGQSYLGTQLHATASVQHWTTRHALGTWDFGLQLAYHNEPTFMAPWFDDTTTGANHRLQLAVTAGHTFHMGKRRRWSLGLHLYGGLNHWRSEYTIDYPNEGVHGAAVVSRNHFVFGGEIKIAYRFHRRVGFSILLGGPFPLVSSYVVSMFHVGLGLSFYLR